VGAPLWQKRGRRGERVEEKGFVAGGGFEGEAADVAGRGDGPEADLLASLAGDEAAVDGGAAYAAERAAVRGDGEGERAAGIVDGDDDCMRG
jgi:hypothetical protein